MTSGPYGRRGKGFCDDNIIALLLKKCGDGGKGQIFHDVIYGRHPMVKLKALHCFTKMDVLERTTLLVPENFLTS